MKTESKICAREIEKKLKLSSQLFNMAFSLKKAQLRQKYSDLDERALNHKTYSLIEKANR